MNHRLIYDRPAIDDGPFPAPVWLEALPVGNGSMGGMFFGGVIHENIQLNEDTLWYGGKDRNRINPDAKKYLEQVRTLLKQGKIREATNLARMSMTGCPQGQRIYSTAGMLSLNFEMDDGQIQNYERCLDLETAVGSVAFLSNGASFKREIFCSYPDQVMVIQISTSQKGCLGFDMGLSRAARAESCQTKDGQVWMIGQEGGNGVSFCVSACISHTDGAVSVIGSHVLVAQASYATILLTMRTSYYGDDPRRWCENVLDRAKQYHFETLKTRHIKDYSSLYQRVNLRLDRESDENTCATDRRLEKVKNGGSDLGLVELYYNYGRYLLIASSRPGCLPANLQGIWNPDFSPMWDSKYTININTQMNYWAAEVNHLEECHLPLFDLLRKMMPNGQCVAQEMYGCRGFVAHHNTDLWGDCAPQDVYMPATIWPMGGAWLATHIWEHYRFTMDLDFLKQNFDILKAAAVFFLDYLFEDEHGNLVSGPSTSPENTYIHPDGEQGNLCIGPSMDSEIIRDVIEDCLSAARLLNCEDDQTKALADILPRLCGLSVGKYGQIMEWSKDYDEAEPGHRHISQLYALYPSAQLTWEKTPQLMAHARATIERRQKYGGGQTGWSRAWMINMWARLHDGDRADENIRALLKESTAKNLFDTHPMPYGGDPIFQIDGNLGACAGIAEMLVQSHTGCIELLPALPSSWKWGQAHGLKARGNFVVHVSWANGGFKSAVIESLSGADCVIWAPVPLKIGEDADQSRLTAGTKNGRLYITGDHCPYKISLYPA